MSGAHPALAHGAVVLAAGLGSRMGSPLPKALLPLGPRARGSAEQTCFLRRQLSLLHAAGVTPLVVVVGAGEAAIRDALAAWGLAVEVVRNDSPDIGRSGSLHSFQYALRACRALRDGSRHTLLLDADILYEARALQRLLDAPAGSRLLYRQGPRADDEQVCVYGTDDAPRFLGKALRPALVGDAPCLGEAIGIVRFGPAELGIVEALTRWMVGDPDAPEGSAARRGYGPARMATEHEALSQHLMQLGRLPALGLPADTCFTECDDAADYARARALHQTLLERNDGAH